MTNKKRIRRLKPEERVLYKDEFWAESNRLQKHDELAKQQQEINKLDILVRKATIENLERQKRGEPVPLTNFAEITHRRQDLEAQQAVTVTTNLTPVTKPLSYRPHDLRHWNGTRGGFAASNSVRCRCHRFSLDKYSPEVGSGCIITPSRCIPLYSAILHVD
jgi:hypothetical protein